LSLKISFDLGTGTSNGSLEILVPIKIRRIRFSFALVTNPCVIDFRHCCPIYIFEARAFRMLKSTGSTVQEVQTLDESYPGWNHLILSLDANGEMDPSLGGVPKMIAKCMVQLMNNVFTKKFTHER
jgi:hypothetical protein